MGRELSQCLEAVVFRLSLTVGFEQTLSQDRCCPSAEMDAFGGFDAVADRNDDI
jgi:hypothetical protein